MALEIANYISQLVSNYPSGTDTESQGDDHIRLIKAVLKTTFRGSGGGGFAKVITATEDEINRLSGVTSNVQTQLGALSTRISLIKNMPTGMITMWSGNTPPAGWFLCDGSNGSPDLRDKFVIGKGTVHALNTEGNIIGASSGSPTLPYYTLAFIMLL